MVWESLSSVRHCQVEAGQPRRGKAQKGRSGRHLVWGIRQSRENLCERVADISTQSVVGLGATTIEAIVDSLF
jgi:hypothetical protein